MSSLYLTLMLIANIRVNQDILDTGLINIFILVAFLIYALTGPSQELLEERQKRIDQEIRNSKSRLKEAERRLKEAHKQYQQAQIARKEIEKRFLEIRKSSLGQAMDFAKKELEAILVRALDFYLIKSEEIVEEITSEIKSRVYNEITIIMKNYFTSKNRTNRFMDQTINKLQNDVKMEVSSWY